MISIQFPPPDFRIRMQEGFDEIFDGIRRQWIKLTPEEWVRQNMIAYLVKTIFVPPMLISIEKEIRVGELKRRFDIVVYDKNGSPWLLVECKAITVNLSGKTIGQTLGYLSEMKCPYIVITNGSYTYGWKIAKGGFQALTQLPIYEEEIKQ
ncbi:MAG: type I restriction enzyme HsdR N-terminal domain-containing protein [Bacteroidota bacterium]